MRFLLGLLALFIIPGSAVACWDGLILIARDPQLWVPLLAGFGGGILLYLLIIRRLPGISTFEHELTHALVALLFFRRIHKFTVTWKKGGQVQYSGNFGGEFGNLLIGMAPYYLPTFSLAAVLVRPFLPATWFPWFDGIIGFTFAYHLFSTAEETKQSWTKQSFTAAGDRQPTKSDIGKVGYIFAFLIIAGLGLFLLGIVVRMIGQGYSGLWPFLKQVARVSWTNYSDLAIAAYSYIAPILKHWFS
ncbi:MAG: M50 family metallopeptidase [Bacteroidetes bacterium]|nr:M50 family metallopeptidase [Bacteroidota bacterium]